MAEDAPESWGVQRLPFNFWGTFNAKGKLSELPVMIYANGLMYLATTSERTFTSAKFRAVIALMQITEESI
jgi:hypothetical protein